MHRSNIAVIGGGISGLSAAWLLAQRHDVTLFEQAQTLGGHAPTVDVETADGVAPVDTGFIVYNARNYPNLTALFETLGVETHPTTMTFALSFDDSRYEYSGSAINGFFGQPRNLLRPRHWRLLADIARFFRTADERVRRYPADTALGGFLAQEGYSCVFTEDHIVPMGAAIWSTRMADMLGFPARAFVDFYANHGMLQFRDRPRWRTVAGGSRNYVMRLAEDGGFAVQPGCPVRRVYRHPDAVHVEDEGGVVRRFDHVVIATHADQALRLLVDPDGAERSHLGAFRYQVNRGTLHRDPQWMPARRRLWSSWNYLKREDGVETGLSVTYWMNALQGQALGSEPDLFLTLNPPRPVDPSAVVQYYEYEHPVFDARAITMQRTLWSLQGRRRTWFCGSYFGSGFHEDGLQSGLWVAEQLGGVRRPWRVADESGRIVLPPADAREAVREAAE